MSGRAAGAPPYDPADAASMIRYLAGVEWPARDYEHSGILEVPFRALRNQCPDRDGNHYAGVGERCNCCLGRGWFPEPDVVLACWYITMHIPTEVVSWLKYGATPVDVLQMTCRWAELQMEKKA